MRHRRHIGVIGVAIACSLGGLTAPATADPPDPCRDPDDPEYTSRACKVQRLRERPFVVVAVVDSGINPYHIDFRLPQDDDMVGIHPSEYIEGYPAAAQRMALSFNAPSVATARARDSAEWAKASGQVAWIDGTVIIGGYIPAGDLYDVIDHGTGVASIAGGRVYGPRFENTLLVAIKGNDNGIDWASQQPWIDVITNSWSYLWPVLDTTAEASYRAVAAGKVVCFASGNLSAPLWFWEAQGPSWHVNVGAVYASDRTEPTYTGWPNDVMGLSHVQAANNDTFTESEEFGGTSGATPAVCGLIAKAISDARARLGDFVQGPHGNGALAVGAPSAGALADGRLVRTELEDAVQATAVMGRSALESAPWARAGYGIVDRDTIREAHRVLFGEAPRPARPDEDRWQSVTDTARNAVWGPPPS